MNLRDFIGLLRSRWMTVSATTLMCVLAAVVFTLLATPTYQASTRLFVSSTAGASASDLYQGNRLSQERVLSYVQLLMGDTLSQRTIDKLDLELDIENFRENIKASAKRDTVLIDVDVVDESPVRARDIANALSDEFVILVRELETPRPGAEPDARVVVEQRATVPTDPVAPKPVRNVAFGLLLGLLIGIGLAMGRDFLDNTVKDRETLEGITETGLVGSIPIDKGLSTEHAINFNLSHSGTAEAFRKLRTNLQFLGVDDPPRLIVVTSSIPAEGKSTTALNIALALAEGNHSVVLVDGDLRRPSVHEYIGVVGSVGLSNVLSGAASLSEVLQTTKYSRLTVLAAGANPPNPSELLGSKAAKKVFSELREKYDYVIIDSPPLLAVTDGAILATSSDGVLLVARQGRVSRDQLGHATGALRATGTKLLGAVFTMAPNRGDSYHHYTYSYHGDHQAQRPVLPSPSPPPDNAMAERIDRKKSIADSM